jgi:hypothetical protein
MIAACHRNNKEQLHNDLTSMKFLKKKGKKMNLK